jgi:hypothetical protein
MASLGQRRSDVGESNQSLQIGEGIDPAERTVAKGGKPT